MAEQQLRIPETAMEAEVSALIGDQIARWAEAALRRPAGSLGPDAVLIELGLDSVEGAHLMARLEAAVGVPLEPELPFLFQSVDELSREIARRRAERARS